MIPPALVTQIAAATIRAVLIVQGFYLGHKACLDGRVILQTSVSI